MEEIRIGKNDAGIRLDKFLMKTFPDLPKSMMYKAIRNKKIKLNRKRAEISSRLEEGDAVLLFLPPDALGRKELDEGNDLPLDIIYEDDEILIANKPCGLLSQPDYAGEDSLVSRIKGYLKRTGKWDPSSENSFSPAICSRLDRNTTGLVLAAKSAEALRKANQAIADHKIEKIYEAKAEGLFDKKSFPLKLYLKKEGTKALVSDHPDKGYVNAEMDVEVLKQHENEALVRINLKTGRFHQIRALLSHIGHPLAGDAKYGSKAKIPYDLKACQLSIGDAGLEADHHTFSI